MKRIKKECKCHPIPKGGCEYNCNCHTGAHDGCPDCEGVCYLCINGACSPKSKGIRELDYATPEDFTDSYKRDDQITRKINEIIKLLSNL